MDRGFWQRIEYVEKKKQKQIKNKINKNQGMWKSKDKKY